MTRVYISGPATGIPDYNRAAFAEAEVTFRNKGDTVFNPHSIAGPSKEEFAEWLALYGMNEAQRLLWQYYMRRCVANLPSYDEIYMLPHWQNSEGAVWEHRIAKMLGLRVSYAPVN